MFLKELCRRGSGVSTNLVLRAVGRPTDAFTGILRLTHKCANREGWAIRKDSNHRERPVRHQNLNDWDGDGGQLANSQGVMNRSSVFGECGQSNVYIARREDRCFRQYTG